VGDVAVTPMFLPRTVSAKPAPSRRIIGTREKSGAWVFDEAHLPLHNGAMNFRPDYLYAGPFLSGSCRANSGHGSRRFRAFTATAKTGRQGGDPGFFSEGARAGACRF